MVARNLFSLLILAGCSTTTLDDLYVQHSQCTLAEAVGCDAIEERIQKRERIIERSKKRDGPKCPEVAYCDWRGCACITREQMRRAFGEPF